MNLQWPCMTHTGTYIHTYIHINNLTWNGFIVVYDEDSPRVYPPLIWDLQIGIPWWVCLIQIRRKLSCCHHINNHQARATYRTQLEVDTVRHLRLLDSTNAHVLWAAPKTASRAKSRPERLHTATRQILDACGQHFAGLIEMYRIHLKQTKRGFVRYTIPALWMPWSMRAMVRPVIGAKTE